MSGDIVCDQIIKNYQWYRNTECKVITFQAMPQGINNTLYVAAIVPETSHLDSILASTNPCVTLNENILSSAFSLSSCGRAIDRLLKETQIKIGKALLAIPGDSRLVFTFLKNHQLEESRKKIPDTPNKNTPEPKNTLQTSNLAASAVEHSRIIEELRKKIPDTPNKNAPEPKNSLLASNVAASAVEHSRMIDELQKTCEALKEKCNSLEKKNEELERRVITDIGSSIAEGLHTKMEKLIGDGLSQLTDKNLSLLEKENMAEATQGPLQSETMMTPNSSAVSDTDVTITSIQGLDHTSETGVVGTWNKIKAVDKQLGWLFSSGMLGDDRMKRYVHQDLKQLANDINAYLDQNK